MGTKRFLTLFVFLGIGIGALIALRSRMPRSQVLHVCTWSNYFPDSVIQEFTQRTGIKVDLTFMSSNEELFAKLKAGATGFDVVQPSDYMVRQMARLGMLAPINHARIPHLSTLEEYYTSMPYDPGLKVSVPFSWGTTGIAINTDKVAIPADGVSWKMLFDSPDPKRTALLDDMREVFGAVFRMNGLDINTAAPDKIQAAKTELGAVKNRILMFTSEPKPLLLREELTVAHVYSCDANQAHAENPKIRYFIPKEGGTVWTDNFAIPAKSEHVDAAHVFIDYFLTPENALPILLQNHLSTPNREAKLKLPKSELDDPNIYPPPEVLKKLQFLDDLGEGLPVMSREWTELKT